MTYIKSPFNFVPVSKNVYFPNWAEQISHDVPFSDGISGVIHLKIKNHTPMFVRNGHTKMDAENNTAEYRSFSNVSNQYFIPATSIKGEVRNVLEILSFSKMDVDHNALFAQREWNNPELYSIKGNQLHILCGWLKRKGDDYEIINCGKPYRISHKDIDKHIGSNILERYFSKKQDFNLNEAYEEFDPKTTTFKYHLLEEVNAKLENLSFEKDEKNCTKYNPRKVFVSESGHITGTIVLTGQPDKWTDRDDSEIGKQQGKYYEFVFANNEEIKGKKIFEVTKETFEHYKFIYQDSKDWERIRKKIESEQGVPVFFRVENSKIKDFGMAYLYKLPYERTPYETLPNAHRSGAPDLAQCIFGYISKDKSLKGRVQFSHAFSTDARQDDNVVLVLNSPKASYYPIYIKQSGQNGITAKYDTYNDGDLSGWKRYYIRKSTWSKAMEKEKLNTVIHPIKGGATFHCNITFHNLRPVELGALLSALTFHNTPNCYHSLGQAKPYGFGKVSYEITGFDCDGDAKNKEDYMACFEYAITKNLSKYSFAGGLFDWPGSDQIVALLTIATSQVDGKWFQYMSMDMGGLNQFVEAKGGSKKEGQHEYLSPVKVILNRSVKPSSLFELGKKINQPKIDAENRKIKELYTLRFESLLSTPEHEATAKFDEMIKRLDEDIESEQDGEKKDCLSILKQELLSRKQELTKMLEQDKDKQTFGSGILEYLATASSYGNWDTHVRKWKKWSMEYDHGRNALTESEQQDALTQLAAAYHHAKKADKKKFSWKKASELLGIEVNENNIMNYFKG